MHTCVIAHLLLSLSYTCTVQIKSSEQLSREIIGGKQCINERTSFMVSLKRETDFKHICGGTLVSSTWILTAAHCVVKYWDEPKHLLAVSDTHMHSSIVKQIKNHEKYNQPLHLSNDIALLQVYDPLAETHFVELPLRHYQGDLGERCNTSIIMGWGSRVSNVASPLAEGRGLQCARVSVITNTACSLYSSRPIYDTEICAMHPKGGVDACQGDSGGPLLCENVQEGIISGGYGCAEPNSPGIYTRTDMYLTFIKDTINSGLNTEPALIDVFITVFLMYFG